MGTIKIKEEKGIIYSNKKLLEIISKSEIKKFLKAELSEKVDQNGLLFSLGSFDNQFGELERLIVSSKPLYNKWTQRIGNKDRKLSVPKKPLKIFFEQYILPFVKRKEVHYCCHGGEVGWSTRRSVESHIPAACMFSFDLSDAFNNVNIGYIYPLFYNLLNSAPEKYKADIAWFLSIISTVSREEIRFLPQGSPIGMALFNRILSPIDDFIYENAKKRGMKFSRWVDDFNLSSKTPRAIYEFLGALKSVEEYFPISKTKIYLQNSYPIYINGQVITQEIVRRNSREERETNKCGNIQYETILKMDYHQWLE